MKKTIKFQKLVIQNRKVLIKQHGFNNATVTTWAYGTRIPNYENALRLAEIFGMHVDDLPYVRVIRNL